jgi:hypothetical protein
MTVGTEVIDMAAAISISSVIYTVTVVAIAVVSVFSRRPVRRRDARETLNILLRKVSHDSNKRLGGQSPSQLDPPSVPPVAYGHWAKHELTKRLPNSRARP